MSHTNTTIQIAALAATLSLGACVVEEDTMATGTNAQSETIPNGMIYNGIIYNGIIYNGLPYLGFANVALPTSASANNGLADITADLAWAAWLNDADRGALNDLLMTYLVSCALTPDKKASYTDASGNTWEWWGYLGLAPNWDTDGLTVTEQRWLTACLASRVNEYGNNVEISQRGPVESLFNVKVPEVNNWTVLEAAFFGNMFAATPVYFSCLAEANYIDPEDGRSCALTDESDENRCGPIDVLGTCNDICDSETLTVANKPYKVFKNCVGADGVNYGDTVITTALKN